MSIVPEYSHRKRFDNFIKYYLRRYSKCWTWL